MSWIEKIALSPFTALYAAGIWFRNLGFKKKWFKSVKFDLPVISIGNLNVGGTGKTPHTEYLIRLLQQQYPLGVLSRGYRRNTSGYIEVQSSSSAKQVGDEPLMYKWKYPHVKVAVSEDRVLGIPNLVGDTPRIVLLDDAFQHRAVRPGISILLTDYSKLYTRGSLLPAGRLREFKSGAERADLIIVTKSPKGLTKNEKEEIVKELNPLPHQYVFFSYLTYGSPYSLFQNKEAIDFSKTTALMLTGIANPDAMKTFLDTKMKAVYQRAFDDHHHYNQSDIESIFATFDNLPDKEKIIITTEKDATRLLPFKQAFIKRGIPIYCLPVQVNFGDEERHKFHKAIYLYLEKTIPQQANETHEHIQAN